MTYFCDNCGNEFDEPTIITETHGLCSPPYEEISLSPCCKDSFTVSDSCCNKCGKPIKRNEYGLCSNCAHDALKRFIYFICNELTQAERLYIDDSIEFDGIMSPENIKAVRL